jgi:hypothetical protein
LNGALDPRDCPYVGLDPFEKSYEQFFFGRKQDSEVIVDHVFSRRITVLYGPSGVGKSSVLNVGVAAALRRPAPWMIVALREWQDPNTIEQRAIEALKAALPAGIKNSQGHARFPRQVVGALRAAGQPLLVILDQFEEYFHYRAEDQLTAVERALATLLARRDLKIHLLIALRDDSLHLLAKLRAIFPGILETTIRLGHLNDVAVEQAIRGPIQQYNKIYRQDSPIEIEDRLVDTLIGDLRQGGRRPIGDDGGAKSPEPIELPYLQLTMTTLWTEEGGREATALRAETLTTKLGGVQQIARKHVEGILSGLTPKEQSLCAAIFRYLVTARGGKIAYTGGDLADQISEDRSQIGERGIDQIVTEEEVAAVLGKLAKPEMRLIKPVTAKGLAAFELFHDVLGTPVLVWRRGFTENERLRAEKKQADEQKAFESFLTAINRTADPFRPLSLLQDLPAYGAKLTDVRAQAAVNIVLTEIQKTADQKTADQKTAGADLVRSLVETLHVLPVKLTDGQTRAATESILSMVKQTTNPFAFLSLAQALPVLSVKLTDEQAQAATESILAAIKRTKPKIALDSLFEALWALAANLTDPQARAAIESVLAAVQQETDPFVLQSLMQALQSLAATERQAEVTVESILAAIKQTTDPLAFQSLAQAFKVFAAKLTHAQVQAAVASILTAIKQTTDPFALQSLVQALQPLDYSLTDAQAEVTVESILAAIKQTTDPFAFQSLIGALLALRARLTDAIAQSAIESILAAIKQTTDDPNSADNKLLPAQIQTFAQALQALATNFTDAQAQAAFESILAAALQTDNLFARQALGRVLPAHASKLTDARAQAAVNIVLAEIQKTADAELVRSLVEALHVLPVKLTDAQARASTEFILSAITQTADPFALEPLAQALRLLPAKLTDAQAQLAIESILAALKKAGGREKLESVAQASEALIPKLTDARAQELRELLRQYLTPAPRM